jgi:hypothetical protein
MNRMGILAGAALGLLIAVHTAAVLLYAPRSTPIELRERIRAFLALSAVLVGGVAVLLRGTGGLVLVVATLATLGALFLRNLRMFIVCVGLGYVLIGGVAVLTTLSGSWDPGRAVAAVLLGASSGVLCVFSAALIIRGPVRDVTVVLLRKVCEKRVIEVALASGALALCYLLFSTTRPLYVTLGAVLFIGASFSLLGEGAATVRLSVFRGVAVLMAVASLGVVNTGSISGVTALNEGPTTIVTAPTVATTSAATSEEKLAGCAAVPQSRYLEQRDCFSLYFIERGDAVGTDKALEELIAVHKSEVAGSAFRPHCHEVLHDFSKDRAAKEGVDALLGSYVITCTGGFAHGLLVTYTEEVGWPSIKAELPTFCTTLTQKVVDAMVKKGKPRPTDTGWLKWNCDHMLGHLVYENTRDNLNEGAQLCTTWGPQTTERDSCGAGFFMEHFLDITRNLNGWRPPKQDTDVFKSCDTITGAIKEWCYSESGVNAAMFTGYDYPKAAGVCNTFVPDEYQGVCYGSVGRILVVTNGFSPEKSIAACVSLSAIEIQAQDACLEEVAGAMLSETFAVDAAKQVCAAVSDASNRAACDKRRAALEKQMSGSGAGGGTGRVES